MPSGVDRYNTDRKLNGKTVAECLTEKDKHVSEAPNVALTTNIAAVYTKAASAGATETDRANIDAALYQTELRRKEATGH